MAESKILTRLDAVSDLPTLPTLYMQLSAIMQNPNSAAKDIAKIIETDQSSAAKILRLVNSSFYGFRDRITNITQAVVILGLNTIRNLLLSISVFEKFKNTEGGSAFDRTAFWKHSIGCAVASHVLAGMASPEHQEDAFAAGLLHDIGKVIIDAYLHDDFIKIVDTVSKKQVFMVVAEKMVLDTTHTEIGSHVAAQWHLPAVITDAIALHHQPTQKSTAPAIVFCVHLADIFCRGLAIGNGGDPYVPSIIGVPISKLPLQELFMKIDLQSKESFAIFDLGG